MKHDMGRFSRRTKIVSRSEESVNNSIKLWINAQEKVIVEWYQKSVI
jgi:hypothetical protein